MSSSLQNHDFIVDGMVVNTKRLNKVLVALADTIKEQDREISKIPLLEDQHSRLKRDVQCLELKISSNEIAETANRSIDHHHDESKDEISFDSSESKYKEITDRISSRRRKVAHEQAGHVRRSIEEANLSKIRREVVGLKAIVGQLQDEFNIEIVNSMDFVKQVDEVKNKVIDIEKNVGSSSSSTNILEIEHSMNETYETLLCSIKDLESRITNELDSRVDFEATKLQKTFQELEEAMKKRMFLWNSKLSSFAKKSEMNALIENFEDENKNNQIRLDFLEDGTLRNEQSLLEMKQQTALITIRRCHFIWRKRAQQLVWSRWQQFVKLDIEQKEVTMRRKRKIRQLLIRHWFSRKKKAWGKWQLYLQWHRRIESLKYQAVKLICNRMEATMTAPVRNAFNRLRRFVVAEKMTKDRMMRNQSESIIIDTTSTNSNDGSSSCRKNMVLKHKEDVLTNVQSNHYELSELLNTFKNDKDGAIYTLAQEVNNLRVYDISKLRRDMIEGDRLLNESLHQDLSVEVCSLETKMDFLEKKVDDNFECLSSQLPEMKRHISELRNSLHGTINRVKIIEQTHRDRIELLCESKEASDEKIAELESDLEQAQVKISGLEYNNDRSQNLVNTLLEKMNDFERSQKKERQEMANELSALQNGLMNVSSEVENGKEERKVLNDNLTATKHELIQAKIAMETKFQNVHDIINSHGIVKPRVKPIIEDGVLYEKIAKKKNYVVQLNCVSDGNKEIDVASHIASFAHDYAAWISFRADHEALQLVVVGNNPDDAIYVVDEMEARRSNLLRK